MKSKTVAITAVVIVVLAGLAVAYFGVMRKAGPRASIEKFCDLAPKQASDFKFEPYFSKLRDAIRANPTVVQARMQLGDEIFAMDENNVISTKQETYKPDDFIAKYKDAPEGKLLLVAFDSNPTTCSLGFNDGKVTDVGVMRQKEEE